MIDTNQIDYTLKCMSEAVAKEILLETSDKIEISVIVPCHNAAEFITPCLESLSIQTLPQRNFEVICIDDFSQDNTVDIISSFAGKIQNLRIIQHKENRKQGAARNSGLDVARGNYVVFLDCDDFFRMDALELLLYHGNQGSEVVASQLLKVRYDVPYTPRPAGRKLIGDIQTSSLKNHLGWFPVSMLISRELVEKHKIRFREGVFFEDIEFCTKVFANCSSCKVIPDQLYYYVQRDSSTVNKMSKKKLSDSPAAMSAVFQIIGENEAQEKVFKETATSWLRLQAARVRDGDHSLSERKELAEHYFSEVMQHGLNQKIGDAQVQELRAIAMGTPKPRMEEPKVGAKTCNSPWEMGLEDTFDGKVIFYCEVDYHIRSAAPIARALARIGIEPLIVDASRSTSFSTNRPMSDEELSNYSDLNIKQFDVAKGLPFSTKALAFVFLNDLTYTSRLIFENFGFGVPTFGFYEGINDDWNLDRDFPRLPYRTCDHLLLPGVYQAGFYDDRDYTVVGLPNVRSRLQKVTTKPLFERAVINVNFTYGVLEDKRDAFVRTAVEGCRKAGLDYVISQHPADKGDLSKYNVSRSSVYDLIDENSLLISRFSTTILEALAAGRPVVYHNPIEERVPKFNNPLGAYSISDSAHSLKNAIEEEMNFVRQGGDVRARATLFLHAHASPFGDSDTADRAASAIVSTLQKEDKRLVFKHGDGIIYVTPDKPKLALTEAANIEAPSRGIGAQLAAQLLLDPIANLPKVSDGGMWAAQAQALVSAGGPAAEHFIKVRDWARCKVNGRKAG